MALIVRSLCMPYLCYYGATMFLHDFVAFVRNLPSKVGPLVVFARFHVFALIPALIVGIVCSAPQIAFITQLGSEYSGIYMLKSDAETHYLARMKNSAEGNGIGNPFLHEYAHEPSATWSYSEWLLALPSRFFDISVPQLSLLYKFLLPAFATLCAYACLFFMSKSRVWSAAGGITLILGSALVNTSDIINLLTGNEVYTQFLGYSRPINPQFSGIVFFVYFLSLFATLKYRNRTLFVVTGLISALAWYVYFYTATFILAMNSVVIVGYIVHAVILKYGHIIPQSIARFLRKIFIQENPADSDLGAVLHLLKNMVMATGISIVGAIPFMWATYRLMSSPYYGELARVAHITASRTPVLSTAWVATLCIVMGTVWIYTRHKDNPERAFPAFTRICIYMILATGIAVNQQVITGIVVQQGHYHWYTNAPLFVFMIWICIFTLISFSPVSNTLKKVGTYIVAGICFITVMSYGILVQYSSYKVRFAETAQAQRFAQVLDWLKAYTEPESTVLAHNDISELIPIYTNNTVAWENHATYYLMSHTRREFTPENILQSPAPHDIVKNYPLDYIVQDSRKPLLIPQTFPARTIAQFGDFTVYKVQR